MRSIEDRYAEHRSRTEEALTEQAIRRMRNMVVAALVIFGTMMASCFTARSVCQDYVRQNDRDWARAKVRDTNRRSTIDWCRFFGVVPEVAP